PREPLAYEVDLGLRRLCVAGAHAAGNEQHLNVFRSVLKRVRCHNLLADALPRVRSARRHRAETRGDHGELEWPPTRQHIQYIERAEDVERLEAWEEEDGEFGWRRHLARYMGMFFESPAGPNVLVNRGRGSCATTVG